MTRWAWVGRLAGFVALFMACAFVFFIGAALLTGSLGAGSSPVLDWWTVLPGLAAAFAATWVLAVTIDGRPLAWLGLRGGRRGAVELVLGSLAGMAIVGATILVLALAGWVSWSAGTHGGVLMALEVSLLLLAAAFAEELLFRGYPFRVLEGRFGPAVALGATSVAFGLLHGGNPGIGPLALVNLTLAGVMLGVAYWRSRSLWFVGGLHFGWNWALAASGLSVSGIEVSISGLDPVVSGPPLWTGGTFGPEGGLTATFLTALGTVWLWRIAGSGRGG
ncbi:CPBP family intramembrane glutamic endopeptidase [Candidatus Palauibacter sp.]|uniref:CPBP family intramembrane glutamic endopeptidase n=1 Tax=Candidatus Palauibacter sp. TaxID=3101350 RepID=UPI003AF2CD6E